MSDELEQEEVELLEPTEALEESEETLEDDPTQPRDEQGRFVQTDQELEDQPEGESIDSPTEEQPQEEEVEEEYEVFGYNADGLPHSIEGSKIGTEGLFIPADQIEEVRNLLSEGRAHRGSFRQRMADSDVREATANTRAAAAEAQTKALMDKMEQLVNKDGALEDFVLDQRNNWEVLKANAAAEGIRVQGAADKERLEQFERERTEREQEPIMDSMLEETILKSGKEANLSQERMEEIYERFTNPVYRAIAFHPSLVDEPQAGIVKGQMVIDYNAIRDEVNRFRGSVEAQEAPKREAKKPPPTVSAKKTSAPAKVGAAKKSFASADEADESLLSGGYNKYFEE